MNHAPGALPDPERDAQFYDGVPARRLFAFIIDFVLVWCMALAIGVLTLGIGFLMLGFIIFAVDFVYRVTTISNRSATLGMRLVGVELRRRDGGRFNLGDALAHTILFYIACSFIILQLISVVLMAGSAMGRGLHDIPLGSTMINSPE